MTHCRLPRSSAPDQQKVTRWAHLPRRSLCESIVVLQREWSLCGQSPTEHTQRKSPTRKTMCCCQTWRLQTGLVDSAADETLVSCPYVVLGPLVALFMDVEQPRGDWSACEVRSALSSAIFGFRAGLHPRVCQLSSSVMLPSTWLHPGPPVAWFRMLSCPLQWVIVGPCLVRQPVSISGHLWHCQARTWPASWAHPTMVGQAVVTVYADASHIGFSSCSSGYLIRRYRTGGWFCPQLGGISHAD